MLSKCKTLKEKEIRRKLTETKDFNPFKLEAIKTFNLSKVSTQHTSKFSNNLSSKRKIIEAPLNIPNDIEEEGMEEEASNTVYMKEFTPEEEATLKNMLSTHFLFANFDDKMISLIVDDLIEFNLDKDRVLYEEGDDGHYFYLVMKGELEVLEGDERKKIIGEGECLGELALLHKSKRTATVRAVTDCILFVLEGTIFREIKKRLNNDKINETLQIIDKIRLLQYLEPMQKYNIACLIVSNHYSKGQKIIKRGEEGDRMYIVKEGHISCQANDKEVKRLGAGFIFGENSLIFETKRSVDVYSIDHTTLYIVTKKNLEEALGMSYRNTILFSFFRQTARDSKFFMSLFNETQFEELYKLFESKKYRPNEIVFSKDHTINKKLVFVFQGGLAEVKYISYRIKKIRRL
jgi:cAMP-dependent protein kinase regulator